MNKTMITQNDITYLIKNEQAIVFCCLGNDKNIIIPDYIYSNDVKYPVTQISKKCFHGNKKIKTLSLPDTITLIGNAAFRDSSIEEINIPKNAILHSSMFVNSKLKKIIFEDGFENIPNRCFEKCLNLEYINLPASIKTIGDLAFSKCKNLKSINVGKAYLGNGLFTGCDSLENVEIDPESDFRKNRNAILNINNEAISYIKDEELLVVHSNVSSVLENSISNLNNVKTIIFNNPEAKLVEHCIKDCHNIENLVFVEGWKNIDLNFFTSYNTINLYFPSTLEKFDISQITAIYNIKNIFCFNDEFSTYELTKYLLPKIKEELKNKITHKKSYEELIDIYDFDLTNQYIKAYSKYLCYGNCNQNIPIELLRSLNKEFSQFHQEYYEVMSLLVDKELDSKTIINNIQNIVDEYLQKKIKNECIEK